jgi:hypothetical protein
VTPLEHHQTSRPHRPHRPRRAPERRPARWAALLSALALLAACGAKPRVPAGPPQDLAATGLFRAGSVTEIAPAVLAFSPQYPLWTDGAAKRRWIRLPPGTSIDASDVDAWRFPVGTWLWKEFAFEGRVETRTMERLPDGTWRYATYVWSADGSRATLAPERGVRFAATSPFGTPHDVPSVHDCRACHAGAASPVLGFSALQLSPDRDPLAPHATAPAPGEVDLAVLVERGLVRGLPEHLVETPPRIAAATPHERAALGYLHGNCGGCHDSAEALAGLGLDLSYSLVRGSDVLSTADGVPSRFRFGDREHELRIDRAEPRASVLERRVATRNPLQRMPALGSHAVDEAALHVLRRWLDELSRAPSTRGPGAS